jgi:hypothetical protein
VITTTFRWSGLLALLTVALCLSACGDSVEVPISRITGPRVIAVLSEPSSLAIGKQARLTVLVVDQFGPRQGIPGSAGPGDRPVDAIRWRACAPWRFISDPGRDCIASDAFTLATIGSGQTDISAAELEAAFPAPPETMAPPEAWKFALSLGIPLTIPILVEVDVDGQTLVTRYDIPVIGSDETRKTPKIAEVRFNGVASNTVVKGQPTKITVAIDPSSIDKLPNASEAPFFEQIDAYFYSPIGTFSAFATETPDPDAPAPETEPTVFTTDQAGDAWIYVVITDRTGGVNADWIPITVQ